MIFVIKITHEGETREVETEKPEVIVGRSTPIEEVDIDLTPDKSVSRKHIILKMEYNMGTAKNEAWMHDQGSSRGTLLNGKPVTDPVKITKGDVIQVGESDIRVHLRKKPKPKSQMSFQEKVETRSQSFGGSKSTGKPKGKPTPPPTEKPPPPPIEESVVSSQDEVSPGVAAALLSGAYQTESAGFFSNSVEDLATAVNRYARENKMHAISASMVQEGKGSSACFRALVVFSKPNTD